MKRLGIVSLILMVLLGTMVMMGCDNGNQPEVKVIAEQYRGRFVHEDGIHFFEFYENSAQFNGFVGAALMEEGDPYYKPNYLYTEGKDLYHVSDNGDYIIGYFEDVNTFIEAGKEADPRNPIIFPAIPPQTYTRE
jgi:hypothetical protein